MISPLTVIWKKTIFSSFQLNSLTMTFISTTFAKLIWLVDAKFMFEILVIQSECIHQLVTNLVNSQLKSKYDSIT